MLDLAPSQPLPFKLVARHSFMLRLYRPYLAHRPLFSRSQCGLHLLLQRLRRAERYFGQELEQDDCHCAAVDYTVGRLACRAGTVVFLLILNKIINS